MKISLILKRQLRKFNSDKLKEECGIFGISNYTDASALVALKTFRVLRQLLLQLLSDNSNGMHLFKINYYMRLLEKASLQQKRLCCSMTSMLLSQFAITGYVSVIESDSILSSPPLLQKENIKSQMNMFKSRDTGDDASNETNEASPQILCQLAIQSISLQQRYIHAYNVMSGGEFILAYHLFEELIKELTVSTSQIDLDCSECAITSLLYDKARVSSANQKLLQLSNQHLHRCFHDKYNKGIQDSLAHWIPGAIVTPTSSITEIQECIDSIDESLNLDKELKLTIDLNRIEPIDIKLRGELIRDVRQAQLMLTRSATSAVDDTSEMSTINTNEILEIDQTGLTRLVVATRRWYNELERPETGFGSFELKALLSCALQK